MYENLKSGSLKIGTLLVILSILLALVISASGYAGIGVWFIIFAVILFLISKRKKSTKTIRCSILEHSETTAQTQNAERGSGWEELSPRRFETELLANAEFYKEAICPYCGEKLDSIPEQKKKCKKCGNSILVWINFKSKEKMLITEEQAEELRKERAEASRVNRIKQLCLNNGISEAQFFESKKKTNYPDNDVLWGLLNMKVREHGKSGDWELYRGTKLSMFELAFSEGKYKVAFQLLVEIIMLDANGVSNSGPLAKRFDKKLSFYAPGIVGYLETVKNELNLNEDEFKDLFIKTAERVYSKDMVLSVNEVWKKLRKELEKSNS